MTATICQSCCSKAITCEGGWPIPASDKSRKTFSAPVLPSRVSSVTFFVAKNVPTTGRHRKRPLLLHTKRVAVPRLPAGHADMHLVPLPHRERSRRHLGF